MLNIVQKKTLTLCAFGILSLIPAKAMADAYVSKGCGQTVSNSLPSGRKMGRMGGRYFQYESGKEFGMPDFILKVRSGMDEPWSECSDGEWLETEKVHAGHIYRCGKRVIFAETRLPTPSSMENRYDLTVLDKNFSRFQAKHSGSKKLNCTFLRVDGFSSGRNSGQLYALGYEDIVTKYYVREAKFTFYTYARAFFAIPLRKRANF